MENLMHRLPMLKLEFTQIKAPEFPHLVDQLEFLADVFEDVMERAYMDLPVYVLACVAYALIYAHRVSDLIPDHVIHFGHVDDSAVVRAVLIMHERDLKAYALSEGMDWDEITTEA
jgi:uncharacterized membrane protein YkvA (DUF1232 family)